MLRFIRRRKAAAEAAAAKTQDAASPQTVEGSAPAPGENHSLPANDADTAAAQGTAAELDNGISRPVASETDAAVAVVLGDTTVPANDASEASNTSAPGGADSAAVATPASGHEQAAAQGQTQEQEQEKSDHDDQADRRSFIQRLAGKISKTSSSLGDGLGQILLGKKEIDDELMEDIETQLLLADVGVDTTRKIIDALAAAIERDALTDSRALYAQLKAELKKTLDTSNNDFIIDANRAPFVILVVGVNGAGKTTTIGKLAKRLQNNKFNVALAAGDTFRAAAVEQLQVWGERNKVPVIAQHTGADSASVIFDGLQASKAREADVLIADTAGRLHNKDHLMEELKKVVRVMGKIDPTAPHEVLLVLDATTGQNAIAQAKTFQQAVGVTGIAVTKLDGTAKGGVVFAIKEQLGLPIRFIGVGEKIEDLRPFEPDDFVEALFAGIE
ncbi:MAG: signal recognition particle-docking protein FtsY [Pseudomonadales bacterium]|nr:signal recognition particle-docking protein FtsY [Gammaproteobacteria bacterium]NNL56365.1 signal recognition particle-docking protein FtsY [Pseudomonadales bacterium]